MALVAVGVEVPHRWSELPRRSSGVPADSRLPLGALTVARFGLIDRSCSGTADRRSQVSRDDITPSNAA